MLSSRMVSAAATAFVATLAISGAAIADNESTTENTVAGSLLPLENRSMEIQLDPELYNSAAHEVNTLEPGSNESADIADFLGADFLGDLIDENGDVNLPLGITVFEAMGTTSLGFGGKF
ncbi:MAG: hypothetical protein ACFBSG_10625 [Leptolyngbyaceae cyanobacterium]